MHRERVRSGTGGEDHPLDSGKRVAAKPCEGCGRECEVDIGRLGHRIGAVAADERVTAGKARKRVVAGEPGERVGTGIAPERIGERRPGDVLDSRSVRQRHDQSRHGSLGGRHGEIKGHAAVEEAREVEGIGVGIRRLEDRHACRHGSQDDIGVAPGAASEENAADPRIDRERVGPGACGQFHSLDAGERVAPHPGKRRRREREVGIPGFDHHVGARAAVDRVVTGGGGERVVSGAAEERVVACEPRETVVPCVARERVSARRSGHVLDPRGGRERQGHSRHDRLRRRHRQIEGHRPVGKRREVEGVGVGIRRLDDRHGRRQRACEHVAVVPDASVEDRTARPVDQGEPVRGAAGRKAHDLDCGKRIAPHPGECTRREREVDIRRLDDGVGAVATAEGIVAGKPGETVVPRISRERVGERRSGDVLEPRRVRECQRQSRRDRLQRRRRQVDCHRAVQERREIERIAVGIGDLRDRHRCRQGASEDVGITPGAAFKIRDPAPTDQVESVRAVARRQAHDLDSGKRVAPYTGERRRRDREIDIGRFRHRVGAVATAESIVPVAAGERVVACEAGERIDARVAAEHVDKRRPDDVLDPRRVRQRHGQSRHDRLRRNHGEIEGQAAVGQTREVERVGVGVSRLDHRHGCRLRAGELVGIATGSAREQESASPTLDQERVGTDATRQVRDLDAFERVASHTAERRDSEEKIDVSRLGYRVGAITPREAVVPGPAGKRIVAAETAERVVPRIAEEHVGERRPDDVLEARLARERQHQPRHERLLGREPQVDRHGAVVQA